MNPIQKESYTTGWKCKHLFNNNGVYCYEHLQFQSQANRTNNRRAGIELKFLWWENYFFTILSRMWAQTATNKKTSFQAIAFDCNLIRKLLSMYPSSWDSTLHKCEQQKYSPQLFNLFILSKDPLYLVISTLSKLFNYSKQHGCLTLFWKTTLCPKAFVINENNRPRQHGETSPIHKYILYTSLS